MILKNFIVFEGIDGSGTTTQIKKLAERFSADRIFTTAEPTSGETGKFIRRMLKGDFSLDARTAAYLFAADRCQHIYGDEGIEHAVKSGKLAVSDRYLFSSLAYQSVFCGAELPALLNAPFPLPELLFYFKIDAKTALSRVALRGGQIEIYEKLDVQKKIAARFDEVIAEYEKRKNGMRVITVDAADSPDNIADFIWNAAKNLPIH
ncbi:MAG: dTMP kinase [Treponema sp.]